VSLFAALVLFCMRGEQDNGYESDVCFCSQTYFCTRLFHWFIGCCFWGCTI